MKSRTLLIIIIIVGAEAFLALVISLGLLSRELIWPSPSPPEGVLLAHAFPGDSATAQLDAAIAACRGERCYVIAPPNLGEGAPSSMPDNMTLVDLRQEAVRIVRRGYGLSDGAPQMFADELNHSTLVAADSVPASESHAQDQAFAGLIDNYSPNLNAVGVWGKGRSMAEGARVWGGFFNVINENLGHDAQLIALEVDVLNYGLPGVFPNASKVGLQIVGLGDCLNTNAIEILSNKKGRWLNGIVFEPDALSDKSTVLGVGGEGPYHMGINFANVEFRDAAIRIAPGQRIRFDTQAGNPGIIYSDKGPADQLVLVAGPGGLRIMDNTATRVLVEILPDGTVRLAGELQSDPLSTSFGPGSPAPGNR